MSILAPIKANWRVLLLALFLTLSLVFLFYPGGIMADDSYATENDSGTAGIHNLEFGLGLDGGTKISAPVVGMTVEDVELDTDDPNEVDQRGQEIHASISEELGLETGDALVRTDAQNLHVSVEIFTDEYTEAEFATALQNAGLDVTEDDVRQGVTAETRSDIETTIDLRVNEAGLAGSRVSQAEMDGTYYIVTEAPGMTVDELRALLEDRGIVEIQMHYPDGEGGQQNETALVQGDFGQIGTASYNTERDYHYVPVSVNPGPAEEYQQRMVETGFTQNPHECDYGNPEREGSNYCLLTVVDGEVVDAHSLSPNLGANMESGEWASSGTFEMITPTQQQAQALSVNLRAGELRAPLDFDRDQTYSISPALADQFKNYSLLIGILSVLTVSGVVYLRYGDRRVALPMILTALSEVVILLGFAALLRMPLDLSHVAGFIAVVGTGVDDLIIIADEVLDEGDVNSRRVFESRFRKAFWIIGAAAATTIIAMSPLAVLSLGDLQGFAIITILGVLIGVLITRPAYGDILRRLLTDK
ncbi:preprotein translocase subunit SecD [Natrialbaceae archaeon A-CW3]